MRDPKELEATLNLVPTRKLRGVLVRRVPLPALMASLPVDFLFTSGIAYRYDTQGIPCVYFAEEEATARAEYERHHPVGLVPFATYFADVRLRQVIDLCSTEVLTILGLRLSDLNVPWVGARTPTATQRLG